MRNVITIYCLIILFQFGFAQDVIKTEFREVSLPFGLTKKIPVEKPKVAFVLSGGGARGAAQIGALRALIEAGIEPDLIVGTSFGSIVGGLFASGYTLDQLDSIISKTNWDDIISVTPKNRRTNLFVEQKITEDRSILTLELEGLRPVIPTSVSTGQNLINFLNQLVIQAPIHPKKNFDELLIPFRAVCTDLITGNPVVLSDGDLSEAMRASSSVSFLLSPIPRDSFLLADGGLVANIPVRIAKQLGAEIVIAINTTSPLRTEEELKLPWYLADQVVSIPLKKLEEIDLKEADFVITPEIYHLSTDFTGLDSIIQLGYKKAKEFIPLIQNAVQNEFDRRIKAKAIDLKKLRYQYSGNNKIDMAILDLLKLNEFDSSELLKKFYELCKEDFTTIEMELVKDKDFLSYKVKWKERPVIKEVFVSNAGSLEKIGIYEDVLKIKGSKFSEEKVVQHFLSILRGLRNQNYSLVSIDKIEFDLRNNVLSASFTTGEVDSIIILGNNKTNSEVISREIIVKTNQIFEIQDLRQSLINLEATNLFENVFAYYKQEFDKENLFFKIKEKNTALARFGLRSDNERNVQIALDIRDENFQGTGTEIGGQFLGGLRNFYFGLEHRSNRIFNTYLNYKINLYHSFINRYFYGDSPTNTDTRWDRVLIGSYNLHRSGVSFSLGSQVEKLGMVFLENRFELARFIPDKIPNEKRNDYPLSIVKISSVFDSRDKYPFPTEGIYMNLFFESALKFLVGKTGYSRIYFDYESNTTYFNRHKITTKFIFGFGDETLPIFEQFRLGGQNSFFGLREDDLLGRQIFITSLEYQFLLPFKIFFDTYTKLRYDLGGIWKNAASIKFNELRHGVGFTIAFDTPIGPAEFSVGRSFYIRNDLLRKPLSIGPYLFYFSIGYPLL
ncbi:MAG: patatin-like phospholipase family protein [Ignavibacteria bacterium]|nr:patatin-like phospholipase family protein [Ignavibacteria bacterium]